jgi:glycine/D-amino acid oxidase-like deaminating enzyme
MNNNATNLHPALETTLWERTSAPGPTLERLHGDKNADIAVIGAGVAGLSTALHLAEAGCSVTVIEAKEPGSEATGKSAGLIAPDFISHNPDQIESKFGEEWGGRLIKLVGTAAGQCFDLISTLNISCDAKQDGFWTPAHNADFAGKLRKRTREWQNRGYKVEFFEKERTVRSLGSPRYCGAMRFAEGGSLNPLAFSRGLADAAMRQGATLYSHSPVTKLERRGDWWRVITDNGYLDAKRVVLCANGGNSALHPAMRRTVLPLQVFEFATTTISDENRALVLHEGGSFTDKQPYMFSARYDGAGRLIAAFPDILVSRNDSRLFREAGRRLNRHFPTLCDPSVEYLWHGTAWLNPSLLPKVYDLQDGVLAIQACNGRGLANNVVLGKEVAAFMTNGSAKSLSVKLERPHKIRGHRAVRHLPSFLMTLAYLRNKSLKIGG